MSQLPRNTPNARRMLMRMSAETRASFSTLQILAIENAIAPRTHAIDIRLLMPLLGKGAYFVLAAGANRRRFPRRLAQDPQNPTLVTAGSPYACRPNAYRMLQRMPEEMVATFSPAQIEAIDSALIHRSHAIDLQLSLPFLGKGAYLIFVAGPNQTKHYSNLQNHNPFVMPAVGASVAIGVITIVGLVQIKGSSLLAKPDPVFAKSPAFHPTVVPFKKTQQECEASDREWIDEQCIDKNHDPSF